MHIFITGGAGYIGSVCVEKLISAGHTVTVWDNLSAGHRSAVDPKAKFIQGDLLDKEKLIQTLRQAKPDAVIHFAGKALVPESMKDPGIYYQVNVGGGLNLLEAMLKADCKKIIFSSTCAVYGVPEKIPMDERAPKNPVNPYGHSKRMFEEILKWHEQIHGITAVALRYFNAAGATRFHGENHNPETHLIPNVLKVALGQAEKVSIYGNRYPTPDGTCIRDYIHVEDLIDAHILALQKTEGGAYNLGTGTGCSVMQVVETSRKVTGHAIPVEVLPPREGDPPRLVAAAHKIKQELGWEPKRPSLRDIIQSAWDWHQG